MLQEVPGISRNGLPPLRVEGIVADSRQLRPGSLFVAIQGTNDNGHLYLADAEQAGAVAALGQEPDPGPDQPDEPDPQVDREDTPVLNEQQARQLLDSVSQNTESLRGHLQRVYIDQQGPPPKDW